MRDLGIARFIRANKRQLAQTVEIKQNESEKKENAAALGKG